MKKLALLLGVLAGLAFAGAASAQAYRNEVSAFGSYTRMHQSGNTTSFSILDLGYGYYFSSQFVGTIGLQRVSTGTFGFTDIGIGAKYYFGVGRRSSFIPFVDAGLGTEKASDLATGSSHHNRRYQFGFGGAYFVTEATSFDVGLHWFRVASDPFSTNGTVMGMGFTTRF